MAKKLITAEEFSLLPDPLDGTRQELFRGAIMKFPLPGMLHGMTCSKVIRRFGDFIDRDGLGTLTAIVGIITERDPDTVRGPDVGFWSHERLSLIPAGYIESAADLLVEVLSPSNTSKQIRAKLQEYFSMGVQMVWVVASEGRFVTVYRNPDEGRILHEKAIITGEDVLPGFRCKVVDLLP